MSRQDLNPIVYNRRFDWLNRVNLSRYLDIVCMFHRYCRWPCHNIPPNNDKHMMLYNNCKNRICILVCYHGLWVWRSNLLQRHYRCWNCTRKWMPMHRPTDCLDWIFVCANCCIYRSAQHILTFDSNNSMLYQRVF